MFSAVCSFTYEKRCALYVLFLQILEFGPFLFAAGSVKLMVTAIACFHLHHSPVWVFTFAKKLSLFC